MTKPKTAAARAANTTPAAPAVAGASKGSTVTVACKVQTGLVLQLCKKTTWMEDTPAGPRERIRYDRVGERVVVRGPAYPAGQPWKGFRPRAQMAGGYALTHGVDAEFFKEWMRQNAENPVVVNKMVFAQGQPQSAAAMGKEHRDTRSGFEPLDVSEKKVGDGTTVRDPRVPKPQSAGLTGVSGADEMKDRPGAGADEPYLEDAD